MKAADPHDQYDPKDPSEAALGDTGRQPSLYVQLAEKLARAIRAGTLARGERMLSVRELARQQQVSQSTVVQAYRWLEDALLIQARPRSGYFVAQRPKSLPEPQTSRPSRLSRKVHLDDLGQQVLRLSVAPDIISFGAAAPEPDLFDQERVRRALIRTVQRHRNLLCSYQLGSGQEAVRRAVARHALGMGCELEADDIIMTNSCLESITLCLQAVTKPGDVVALESPTYFGFLEILQSLHLRALEIPTHPRHGVSLDALQLALETQPVKAVLLVPTLSNPLGCSMSLADRRRLAQLVQARNVALIEDAVYNDLAEQEDKRRAVKSFDRSGQVMLCGSFSKTMVPGLRLGWVAAGRWTPGLRKIQTVQSGVQTAVLELTLAELLGQSGNEAALRQLRATLAQRVDLARRLIAESFPKGSRITDPGGGFILWVELPAGIDALHLYEACLAENICIAPGQLFSAGPRFKHCLRLSVGGRWGPAHPQALRRIGELARELLERGSLSLAA